MSCRKAKIGKKNLNGQQFETDAREGEIFLRILIRLKLKMNLVLGILYVITMRLEIIKKIVLLCRE